LAVTAEFDTSSLARQFSILLGPLSTLKDLHTEGPIVIVLDALDECGTPQSRRPLLKVFHK
jgi:hypothetical protein